MKNLSASRAWKTLQYHLNLKQTLQRRAAAKSPAAFRQAVRMDAGWDQKFSSRMQPWQQTDFEALDPAWLNLAGFPVPASQVLQRAYLERPRGHSKTTDMAIQLAWILQYSPTRVEGLAAAADLEQGTLIRNAVQRLAQLNPHLCPDLEFRQHAVINRVTQSRLTIISSDVQSSWGQLPDFVICDELSHWEKPDLWYSLISSAAKKPNCVLAVLTNAGVGEGWQWEVREAARTSPRWHFSSLPGCQAPWITEEWLDEQRQLLPASVFDRLWNNAWQLSDGSFVSLAEAEACREDSLTWQAAGQAGVQYVAAVDYAEKHDHTVGVVVHQEGERLVVDRMDVVCPQPDSPVPVAWVERWITEIAARFPGASFLLDEYQLLGLIQKYQHHLPIKRFPFLAGKGNHALAVTLRKLILNRQIGWYPGCGQLDNCDHRDDIETELASVFLKQSSSGRCRIDHTADGVHHDDRVFTLGAAALAALQTPDGSDWLDIQPPSASGDFLW